MNLIEQTHYWTNNYHHFEENELDSSIYRIYKLEHFLEMINKEQNTLVKPSEWDDPWENLISRANIMKMNGENVSNNLYAQCWTLEKESDLLWRVYSPDKKGIKVKTTIAKLFLSLYNSLGDIGGLEAHIGKIQYKSDRGISEFFKDIEFDSWGKMEAKSLLFKRKEFKSEKEVRLIYNFSDNMKCSEKRFSYEINPISLFNEIVFDPRMDISVSNLIMSELERKKLHKKVKKSKLYQTPNFNIGIDC